MGNRAHVRNDSPGLGNDAQGASREYVRSAVRETIAVVVPNPNAAAGDAPVVVQLIIANAKAGPHQGSAAGQGSALASKVRG